MGDANIGMTVFGDETLDWTIVAGMAPLGSSSTLHGRVAWRFTEQYGGYVEDVHPEGWDI